MKGGTGTSMGGRGGMSPAMTTRVNKARTRRKYTRAGPVTTTKADGTVQVERSYSRRQLLYILGGDKAKHRARR
ncbi:MAG: hypothetical protein WD645_02430 [Dehalococcoidia bacterium]